VTEVSEQAGFGVHAKVDGREFFVGNEKWMRLQGVEPLPSSETGTRVYVSDGKVCLGVITVSDRVKENAAPAVTSLRRLGVLRAVMLTGDGEEAARAVAAQAGLDGYCANLLPETKVEQFRTLAAASESGITAYVGDGMNDAPVLASAPLGIAMGGIGSDAAIEAADAVLMRDDLSVLPTAVALARKTRRIVLQNLVFSIGIKVLVLLLCAVGFANMWYAVFADVGVSVLAILNAMRTLSKKI